jgi:hypothetical protein
MTTYQHSATFHPASMAGAVTHTRYPQASWRLGQPRPTLTRLARWVVAALMVLVVTLAALDLTMGYTFDGSAGAPRPVPSYGLGL